MLNTTTITSTFDLWKQALLTKDPINVCSLYDDAAILLPTLSSRICNTHESRRLYFEEFLKKEPRCSVIDGYARDYQSLSIYSGTYSFLCKGDQTVVARFTFVYKPDQQGKLAIIEHHSSLQPGS